MTEFDDKMRELRAEYRRTVAADIRGLQQEAAQLRGDEQDRAALERVAEVLHRMAGGGGVFDLQELSHQSRALELGLLEWLAAPLADVYCASLPDLRAALAALAAQVHA